MESKLDDNEDNLLPILSILLSKKQFDDISNNVETQIT